jgi:hypothetical protein
MFIYARGSVGFIQGLSMQGVLLGLSKKKGLVYIPVYVKLCSCLHNDSIEDGVLRFNIYWMAAYTLNLEKLRKCLRGNVNGVRMHILVEY